VDRPHAIPNEGWTVTRLILLVMLGLITGLYFPATRSILLGLAEPVIVPVVRWSNAEEMDQIARNVVEHERLTGQMPAGTGWLGWLDYRYSAEDMRLDPWGTPYELELSPDSVWIVSLGPDRTRQTDDDFNVAAPRG